LTRIGQVLRLETQLTISTNTTNSFDLVFQLHTTNKPSQSVLTWPVQVRMATNPPIKAPELAFSVTNSISSNTYNLTISTNANDALIQVARDLIKADLEKSKPNEPSNTVLSVLVNKKPESSTPAEATHK
jgi:hypothetical protein